MASSQKRSTSKAWVQEEDATEMVEIYSDNEKPSVDDSPHSSNKLISLNRHHSPPNASPGTNLSIFTVSTHEKRFTKPVPAPRWKNVQSPGKSESLISDTSDDYKMTTINACKSPGPESIVSDTSDVSQFQKRSKSRFLKPLQSPMGTESIFSDTSDTFQKRRQRPIKHNNKLLKSPGGTDTLVSDTSDASHLLRSVRRADSVDVSSPSAFENQSVFSFKSDTKSYREKLRERFKSVKQQAGDSVLRAKKINKKKKSKRKQKSEEFLEYEREDSQLTIELKNHEKKKSFWDKSLIDKVVHETESYDFFCRDNVSDFKDDDQEEEDRLSSDEIEKNVDSKQLNKEVSLDIFEDGDDVIEFIMPKISDYSEFEIDKLFCFTKKPVDIEEKLGTNVEPRFLEDEGLYMGNKPEISSKDLNLLEQRLFSTGNMKWFGCDGELHLAADPRGEILIKPQVNDDQISPELLLEYTPPTLFLPKEDENQQSIQNKRLLEISIISLKFVHHSLFSPEHVLVHKLLFLHDQYEDRLASMHVVRLGKKLAALRQAKINLENSFESYNDLTQAQKERYQMYLTEIKQTREVRENESKIIRDLLKSILTIWKHIKFVREHQKFSNTNIRLAIKVQMCDFETEKQQWDIQIENEIEEIIVELNSNYQNEVLNYKRKLKEWKQSKKMKRRNAGDAEQNAERPVKPKLNIDSRQIKRDVNERFLRCFKPPGEPNLLLEMYNDHEITKEIDYPRERIRRNMVKKVKIFLKLFFNDKEVCKTKSVNLNENFSCYINENIPMQITSNPEKLKIQIFEQHGSLIKHTYDQIFLNIPNETVTSDYSDNNWYDFKCSESVNYSHTGVGSGTTLKKIFFDYNNLQISNDEDIIYNSGTILCNIGWTSSGELENTRSSTTKTTSPQNELQETLKIDKLQKWLDRNKLDPHDPKNALIFQHLKDVSLEGTSTVRNDYFRLNPVLEQYDFCTMKEIEENMRFRLLKLRHNGEPEFRGLTVPNREKGIPPNIFDAYEKRISEESDTFGITEHLSDDPIDSQREWGKINIKKIRNRVLQLCKIAQKSLSYKDIVLEDTIPDFGTLGLTFMKWFKPNRPLRPERKTRQLHIKTSVLPAEVKLVVNIVQAFNVPIRKDADLPISPSKKSVTDTFTVIPIRPYVTVTFKNQTVCTTVAEGANPTWCQELTLPIDLKDVNLSNNIFEDQMGIDLQLFDETVIDLIEDDRLREFDVHQRRQPHWLAGLRIPFSTVIHNNRIEGTFKMDSPPLLLGYERQTSYDNKRSITALTPPATDFPHPRDATYLTLFATLQPTIGTPHEQFNSELLECGEVEYVHDHLRNWHSSYIETFTDRNFTPLVVDTSGKIYCATRYLSPLNLPVFDTSEEHEEELDCKVLEQQCLRFVSLIPFANTNSNIEIGDVWLMADQMMKLLIGSVIDHSVLLQCFFMSLEKISWIVLGYGIPHGHTAYVLAKETDDIGILRYFIYDTTSAEKYDVRDTFCPLKKVYCLISNENIWANIQREDRAHMTRYDVTKSSDWLPAFNQQILAPTSTLQPSEIQYLNTPDISALQERIEQRLRNKIMKWRKHSRTIWNRYCSVALRKLLPILERQASSGMYDINTATESIGEIQNLLSSYKICGFPLNIAYTTIKAIVDSVRVTDIHRNENPKAEFALAVYVHSYPNSIIAVWIYVASLERRR